MSSGSHKVPVIPGTTHAGNHWQPFLWALCAFSGYRATEKYPATGDNLLHALHRQLWRDVITSAQEEVCNEFSGSAKEEALRTVMALSDKEGGKQAREFEYCEKSSPSSE